MPGGRVRVGGSALGVASRRYIGALCVSGLLFVSAAPVAAASSGGTVLVRFSASLSSGAIEELVLRAGGTVSYIFSSVPGLVEIEAVSDSAKRASETLRGFSSVLYAEPDSRLRLEGAPKDPMFDLQWGLENRGDQGGDVEADVDAIAGWSKLRPRAAAVVAVIDSGIDTSHPDLAENLWRNPSDCDGDGIDSDYNGYVDDCHGADPSMPTQTLRDDEGHGTFVSGIIGATRGNDRGISGVAPNVEVLGCAGGKASGALSLALRCFDYVAGLVDRGVPIVAVNASWTSGPSASLKDLVVALGDRGVYTVAAAGNYSQNLDLSPRFPASIDDPMVIAVGASDRTDSRVSASNYGRAVDLMAPGSGIWSTDEGGGYSRQSGTSAAAPVVSGILATLAAEKKFGASRIGSLLAGADRVPQLENFVPGGLRADLFGAAACEGATFQKRTSPIGDELSRSQGRLRIKAISVGCEGSVPMVVSWSSSNGESGSLALDDDGQNGDSRALDGERAGALDLKEGNSYVFEFPGDPLRVQVPIVKDVTPPIIRAFVDQAPQASGWHVGDVHVKFNFTDPESGISDSSGCGAVAVVTDGTHRLTCRATNGAGESSTKSLVINRDASIARISLQSTPSATRHGWIREPGQVKLSASDPHSGVVATRGCQSYRVETEGLHSFSCEATNGAGLVGETMRTIGLDRNSPNVSARLLRAPEESGWYRDPVIVKFDAADALSGIDPATACPDLVIKTDGEQTVRCSVADLAGWTASANQRIRYDATPPILNASFSSEPIRGWHTVPVRLSWECADATSGVAAKADDSYWAEEGAHTAEGWCRDIAGSQTRVSEPVRLDFMPPTGGITSPSVVTGPGSVSGWATDTGSGPNKITLELTRISDGQTRAAVAQCECVGNSASWDYDMRHLPAGDYLIAATIHDRAGRSTSIPGVLIRVS